jgi:hypothetical protein
VVNCIERLRQYRQDKTMQIYEVLGISDVMRGSSKASETATAQQIKAQFGSTRIQLSQFYIAEWITHALRIKADIISKHFQPETIATRSNIMRTPDAQYAQAAIALIKDEQLAEYRISVEADSMAAMDYAAERDAAVQFMQGLGAFVSQVAPMAQQVPGAAPYLLRLLQWAVSKFRVSSEIEGVLDQAIGSMQQTGVQPQEPSPMQQAEVASEMAKAKEHALFISPHDVETTSKQLKHVLKKRRFGVYFNQTADSKSENNSAIYATKGNFSRFGPVVAHLGILLMLIFSVYGAFTGFKAQKLAVPGSQFNLMESEYFMPNVNSGIWQGGVPNWTFKVEDFRIEFYPNNPETIKQYFCKLKILAPSGKTLAEKTISVNDPLSYKDLTVYQASYSPTGKLFLEVNGRPITFEVNADFNGRPISVTPLTQDIALVIFPFFVQQDPGVKNNHITVFLQKDNRFVGTPGQMPPNLKLNMGETGEFAGLRSRYIRPEYATGLQIKQAPEVPWMYMAFGIIMLGTLMCIFSQRMLWAGLAPLPKGQGTAVYLLHKTNKAKASYMKELSAIEQELLNLWPKQSLPNETSIKITDLDLKPETFTNNTLDPNQEPALR